MSSLNQASHPLAPITAAEIKSAALLAKGRWPANVSIGFKAITLQEPEKHLVVGYLEAERQSKRLPSIDRKVFVVYTIKSSVRSHPSLTCTSVLVADDYAQCKVEHNVRLGPFEHPNADPYELMMVEKLALEDPRVKAELAKLELPTGAKVMTDPWGYGT
ncbi:copper methylamine oxidase precursor [Ilyonectria robusta]